jgi:Transmembrane secretion effector
VLKAGVSNGAISLQYIQSRADLSVLITFSEKRTRSSRDRNSTVICLERSGLPPLPPALLLPWLKAKLGPDRQVAAGTLGTALAVVLFGLARDPAMALVASIIAGASWIAVLSKSTFPLRSRFPTGCEAAGSRSSSLRCSGH